MVAQLRGAVQVAVADQHALRPLPQVRSLGETVRLDARTKLLNPK